MTSQDEQTSGFLNETVKDAKEDKGQYEVKNTGDQALGREEQDEQDEQFKEEVAKEGSGGVEGTGGVMRKVNDSAASVSMGF